MNYLLPAIIISLIFFYAFGGLISILIKDYKNNDAFYDTFVKTAIGFLFIVFVYAVYKTNGNTVLWGFILIGLLFLFKYLHDKKNKTNNLDYANNKISIKQRLQSLCVLIGLGTVFFFFQSLFFYNDPINNLPQGDFGFYSNLVNNLNQYGIESTTRAKYAILNVAESPVPYHYPELWLAALISKITGILALETQVIAIHSILGSILSLGMLALCRLISKSFILQIFSIISVYFSGLMIVKFLPQADIYIFANAWNPKTITISIFFVWFAILAIQKNLNFIFPIIIIPLLNIALAPTIFTSSVLFLFFLYFKKHFILRETIISTLFVFFTAVFIALFYFLNSNASATGNFTLNNIIEGLVYDKFKSVKIIVASILISLSVYFFYFTPLIFILKRFLINDLIIKLKNQYLFFSFFLISFFTGLFIWSITHPVADSIQFFYMPGILLANIAIWVLLLNISVILKDSKTRKYLYFAMLIIIVFVNFYTLPKTPFYKYIKIENLYSQEYLSLVQNKVEKTENSNKIIAFIRNPDAINGYWQAVNSYGEAYFMHLFYSGYQSISLDVLYTSTDIYDPITKTRIESYLNKSTFKNYAESNLSKNPEYTIGDLQYKFVTENKINFLILGKEATLPESLSEITDTIIFDHISGKRFVVFKNDD